MANAFSGEVTSELDLLAVANENKNDDFIIRIADGSVEDLFSLLAFAMAGLSEKFYIEPDTDRSAEDITADIVGTANSVLLGCYSCLAEDLARGNEKLQEEIFREFVRYSASLLTSCAEDKKLHS